MIQNLKVPSGCPFLQIRFAIDQLEGPQPVDVRLMKKKTGEINIPWTPAFPQSDHRANLLPFRPIFP